MDPRLQLPDATAWAHAASSVSGGSVESWAAAVDEVVASFMQGGTAASGNDAQRESGLVHDTALFLIPRVVSWAPGMNGSDPATDLVPALVSAGIAEEHADVVARAWSTNAKALVTSARKRATRVLATSGNSAEPSFLRYHGAAVRVARGSANEENGAAIEKNLHEPVMSVALPPSLEDGGASGTQLVLGTDAAYAMFEEIDRAQRAIDGLFDARGTEHTDPSMA